MQFEFVPQAGIYVGRFEVTEGNYAEVMGIEPRGTNSDLPAASISYREAGLFVDALKLKDGGFLKANLTDGDQFEYGIPRIAEWQLYAPPVVIGQDLDAVIRINVQQGEYIGLMPVHRPRKPTNARLFDLYGNVAEWCEGSNGLPEARGGSYNTRKSSLTVVPRLPPGEERFATVGLRCVLRRK